MDEREPLTRLTVNLTSRSVKALGLASRVSGDSRTDVVNRALQVYAYLESVRAAGGEVWVTHNGVTERVVIM